MRLETDRLIIRDLRRGDESRIQAIVRQRDVVRFMRDWSENCSVEGRLARYIDWHQTQADSTDVYENKRYAVALKQTDLLIGTVGMGMEETLNEVEMAYFVDEAYRGNGYAAEAVAALFDWCMAVSSLPYLILTVDCANTASCRAAEKAGFTLFERRTPIGHKQPNMESESYFYYRKARSSAR